MLGKREQLAVIARAFDVERLERMIIDALRVACDRQAFRLGRATYAFQFHPEATGDILRGWASRIREEARQSNAEMLHRLEDSIATHMPVAERFTRAMTRRWLDLAR